eukprot:9298498-Heterocapsa_arctica.AAC.1
MKKEEEKKKRLVQQPEEGEPAKRRRSERIAKRQRDAGQERELEREEYEARGGGEECGDREEYDDYQNRMI